MWSDRVRWAAYAAGAVTGLALAIGLECLPYLLVFPLTIAISFILLNAFGITSNIMSLTGIALAIGVIVDNGIILAENAYKHLSQRFHELNPETPNE